MKKPIVFTLFCISMLLSQCSTTNDNPVIASGGQSKTVEIAIAIPPGFDTLVYRAVARVSAGDMKTIEADLGIDSISIHGKIPNIPVGTRRLFEVVVYDFNGNEAFMGSRYTEVTRGLNYVNITLFKVTDGTAIITGKFDDSAAYSPITLSHTAHIGSRDRELKMVWVLFSMNASCSTMSAFDNYPFEYRWMAVDADSGFIVDSSDWSDTSMSWMNPLRLSWNQTIHVFYGARYKDHPEMFVMDSAIITIRDGWMLEPDTGGVVLTDTIRGKLSPDDTLNIGLNSPRDTIRVWANGRWCMGKDICCSADGDCSLDKDDFIESDYCGGALLARNGDKVYEIGEEGDIINAHDDFMVTLFANRLRDSYDQSGTIEIIVYHTHR